jgi:glutaredoxin
MKLAVFFCFLCMFMVFAAQSAQSATMYRWIDAQGKVHYTDQPPPAEVRDVTEKKLSAPAQASSQTPYTTQAAVRNFPVTLYVSNCGDTCNRAREHLNARSVPFSEKDPTDPAVADALKKLTGDMSVPVLLVGKAAPIKGYGSESWDAALDVAGYPKKAANPKPGAAPAKAATEAQDGKTR